MNLPSRTAAVRRAHADSDELTAKGESRQNESPGTA
jgi:hypothetical protein